MKTEGQFLVSNKADAVGLSIRISTIEKWLPAIATLWFFVSLDSIIVWNPLSPLIRLFALFGIVWGTMIVKPIGFSPRIRLSFFLYLGFALLYIVTRSDTIIIAINRICTLLPLLFIMTWKVELLAETYSFLRKCVIFFAIGAAIVSILSIIGLIRFVPHYTLPPQELLHVRFGYVYDVYGLFVTLHDPLQTMSFRACGMMKEPGHFAVVLGFVYMIDRFQGRNPNIWIVICGLLTFSANFPLFILFTEFSYLFQLKHLKKVLKWIIVVSSSLYVVFISLPSNIQDEVSYLAYGRNLEKVVEAASTSSSMDDALDERASDLPLMVYERMSFSEKLFGVGRFDTAYALSDYRGMIMTVGIVGMSLSALFYIFLVFGIRRSLALSLLLAYTLILVHRSWMLCASYVYFLGFLAVSTNNSYRKEVLT